MGRHRRNVWTVVGTISDDVFEVWTITGVHRGNVPQRHTPPGRFGFGLVVDAATGPHARRVAERQYAAYQAGTLDYSVTMVQAGTEPTRERRWPWPWSKRRAAALPEPEPDEWGPVIGSEVFMV